MTRLIETDPILTRLITALREAFRQKGIIRKGEMANYLEYRGPYFSGVINGREKLSEAFLLTLNQKLGLNPRWILHEEGSMFDYDSDIINSNSTNGIVKLVPLVPLYAHGGSLSNFAPSANEHSSMERIPSPIKDVDYAITVAGDSMAPEYPNGSIVLIRRIIDAAFIEWGKSYVIDTCNGIVIKRLVPADDPGYVRCLSINPDPIFAPFDIAKQDIYGLFAIRFSMTRH